MNAPLASDPHRPNLSTEEFLSLFPGHWVQYFDDGPGKDRRKALAASGFDPKEALRKQSEGCGVFYSPNAFDGARRLGNLLRVQAAYVDIDLRREGDGTPDQPFEKRLAEGLAALRGFSLPPHAIVRTKNGLQAVWRTEPLPPPEGLPIFRLTQERLVAHFRADPTATDATRVLRLPGFDHLKDPASPFRCDVLHFDRARDPYTMRDLLAAIPTPVDKPAGRAGALPGAHSPAVKPPISVSEGVAQGGRNIAAAAMAGKLLAGMPAESWQTHAWPSLKAWNAKNRPPLAEGELRSVYDSIARLESGKRTGERSAGTEGGQSQADRLAGLATREDATYFLDQFGRAHVTVAIDGHRETWAVRSKPARLWLAMLLWRAEGRAPTESVVSAAAAVLEGLAQFGGRRATLHNRVAWHEGALWYDLTNAGWEAVRVTASGWAVVKDPPVLFRRYAHAEPQCTPEPGGDVKRLLRFANLTDAHQQTLLLVYLISCFLPDIPHPVAVFHGPHGAAKTTLARALRRLIDPSFVHVAGLPQSVPGLIQQLSHAWFTCFDNVSELPDWASDTLCRAVTGEGFFKRELYTDDEDVLYAFRRCVAITGINVAARKADLLDRSLLFRFGRVCREDRRSERALWAEFDRCRPAILGGIFDALADAMRRHPRVRLASSPRMADFAEWGEAIAGALGIPPGDFHAAHAANQRERHEEAIDQNITAWALTAFMQDKPRWEGTPADLLRLLGTFAEQERVNTRAAGWPGLPNALMRRLNEARGNLADAGIAFETRRISKGRRLVCVKRIAEPDDTGAGTPSGTTAGGRGGDGRRAKGGDAQPGHRHPASQLT